MSEQPVETFLELCHRFDNYMLVTQNAEGQLVARPMMVAEMENNGDLWFATDMDSGKVDEILAKPAVCVTMAGDDRFVSLSGLAQIVNDRNEIQRLWKDAWKLWFPAGPEDPRLVLIRVHAAEGEYWSNAGTNRIKYLFEAAKAYLKGERIDIAEGSQHGHVDLVREPPK
jgi:general stress protein 26